MLRIAVILLALLNGLASPAWAGLEVNLSGYENAGAKLNWQYVLPGEADLRYFAGKGMTTIRLPMRWERLQPVAYGGLDEAKLAELDTFLALADSLGVKVIADLHNYGRREWNTLGTTALPVSALASFWQQFAKRYAGRFAGYDIMNEPHDMPSPYVWPQAAQSAVWGIRKYDTRTRIYVEGDGWASATQWRAVNEGLSVYDPSANLVYSAHAYFDTDSSGTYKLPYALDGATPATAAARAQLFIGWCRAKKVRCHFGEFGVPFADKKWLPVLDAFLDTAAAGSDVLVGTAYWAAGPWQDTYALTIQPAKDGKWTDRPQMPILLKAR